MDSIEKDISQAEFIVGGYYFVQGSGLKPWMNSKLLPSFIWSASGCLCEKIPDNWILPWLAKPDPYEERRRYQNALGLNDDEFKDLQKQFDNLFRLGEFGYPNVFMRSAVAEDFYARYFHKLPNLKLISISLPKAEVTNFVEENKPSQGVGENGITIKLRQYQKLEEGGVNLGFEVLGYDYSDFHSLICCSMEEEINLKYRIDFNQYGLIDRFEDAISIVRDIREGVLAAEEGDWAPWLVSEYPLNK